jgi:hypothetical protein
VRPRFDDEGAATGDLGLAAPDSLFIKARRFEIMEDVRFRLEAEKTDRYSRIERTSLIHGGFLD